MRNAIVLVCCLLLPASSLLQAQDFANAGQAQDQVMNTVPKVIGYQGYLTDNLGNPVNASTNFTFNLYTSAVGGTALWTETHTGVQVAGGVYNVALGSVAAFGGFVNFNDALYLGVRVNGAAELTPRTMLTAVPYALGLKLPYVGIAASGSAAMQISHTGTGDGIQISDAGDDGVHVENADDDGIYVKNSGDDGVSVSGTGGNGVYVFDAGGQGVRVQQAGSDGFVVQKAGNPSTSSELSTKDGFEVGGAEGNGLRVGHADLDGVHVASAYRYGMHIQSTPSTDNGNSTLAYVGLIENKASGASADGLAIKVSTPGNPGTTANFMGFFKGNGTLIGQIEGNGSGGVAYNTTGADYAEYLPHLHPGAGFGAGDVVGVFGGKISHRTEGADQVMVITDRAAVLGNAPAGDNTAGFEAVSFIGQVPVRTAGRVAAGDYILASGREDGTAVAVHPTELKLTDLTRLVGRAWEASGEVGVKRVNAAVGLDRSEVLLHVIARQQAEIDELRTLIETLLRPQAYTGGSRNGK